jgi:hypothetical protein
MMKTDEFNLRQADLHDIPFLVDTIIEAEKAGSNLLSWTTVFGLSETDARKYIAKMLNEEIDGCELSVSSFLLAEHEGRPVAALSAWIEGKDNESSAQLKGNLLSFVLPVECIKRAASVYSMLQDLHIEHVAGTIQKGAGYVVQEYRGKHLFGILTNSIIDRALTADPSITAAYTQVYNTNIAAIKANQKVDFKIVSYKESMNQEILQYVPSNKKLLLRRNLNQ